MSSASVATRRAECERILARHPNALPLLLQSSTSKTDYVTLAPAATVADVAAAIRDIAGIPARKPVALTVDGCVPAPTTTVAELHAACKNAEDGLLHVSYTAERKMGFSVAGPCFAAAADGSSGSSSANPPIDYVPPTTAP